MLLAKEKEGSPAPGEFLKEKQVFKYHPTHLVTLRNKVGELFSTSGSPCPNPPNVHCQIVGLERRHEITTLGDDKW